MMTAVIIGGLIVVSIVSILVLSAVAISNVNELLDTMY